MGKIVRISDDSALARMIGFTGKNVYEVSGLAHLIRFEGFSPLS